MKPRLDAIAVERQMLVRIVSHRDRSTRRTDPRRLYATARALIIPTSLALIAVTSAPRAFASVWTFTNVTTSAGFNYQHGYVGGASNIFRAFAGGVAAGDYNRDGYVDLYVVRGDIGPNLLFRNNKNGTFQEVGASAGVNLTGTKGSGPTFADFDGDGWLDLVIGGVEGTAPALFRNLGNGSFQNVTAGSGVAFAGSTFSCSWGDYDRDSDLDLFLTHWGAAQFTTGHLWRNNGNGTFTDADVSAGLTQFGPDLNTHTYTTNFADIDGDLWPDLLVASDFRTSEIYMNDGDGTFTNTTPPNFFTECGMGAGVADYDDDGDLDWFITGVWEPDLFRFGNGLYRNDGAGTFTDVTDIASVRYGSWGWASSFADFDNDCDLDIYHVNGFGNPPFNVDPAVMFVSNGDGTFIERGAELGVNHTGLGRGIACFDYDRDGDLDIFIANNSQAPVLYRNDGGNALRYLSVTLTGEPPNTQAIGACIYVTAAGKTQMRELRAGSNYVSQDPAEAHFGMGTATIASEVRIVWPNGQQDVLNNIPTNFRLSLTQNGITGVAPTSAAGAQAPISLLASAPNPFGETTTLLFDLAGESPVAMQVIDSSGRIVRSLDRPRLSAGQHSIVWDGKDDAGREVPAGVYLYRIGSIGGAARGKLVVVR